MNIDAGRGNSPSPHILDLVLRLYLQRQVSPRSVFHRKGVLINTVQRGEADGLAAEREIRTKKAVDVSSSREQEVELCPRRGVRKRSWFAMNQLCQVR